MLVAFLALTESLEYKNAVGHKKVHMQHYSAGKVVSLRNACQLLVAAGARKQGEGMIKHMLLAVLFCVLHGCGPEKDIPSNSDYGKGEQIKIMKFYADWCPPCQAMKPDYEKVKELYPYIEFEEVDFDKNKKKVFQHDVTSIPLIIKSRHGKEASRSMGYMSRNDLIRFIEK